jgi:hypothetical protein
MSKPMKAVKVVKRNNNKGHSRSATPNKLASPHNYKLPPSAVQTILDLTVFGASVAEIVVIVKDHYGVSITHDLVTYYRRKNRGKIIASVEEEIATVRAACPEGSMLVGRIKSLARAIEREFAKPNFSGQAIASLVSAQNQAIYQAEMLRLRYRELEARYPSRTNDVYEKVQELLRQRTQNYREVTARNKATMDAIGGEDALSPEPRSDSEIIQDSVDARLGKGMGEDDLTK